MDCEKFEETLIDELYDELDELTSAAAKRHASGCSRCAALLNGLRATRKVAMLPVVMPPPDLEERILEAAREAQKVVPFRSRLSHAVAWAGSWAMRPQTAMAAVFLLAIGTSFVLMRSKSDMAPASAMRVRAEGSPVVTAAPTAAGDLDTTAVGAHGVEEKEKQQRAVATPALLPDMANASAARDLESQGFLAGKDEAVNADGIIANAGGPSGGAPLPAPGAAQQGQSVGGGGGGAAWRSSATLATKADGNKPTVDFQTAMNAYRSRRFDEAAGDFDSLAAADANAALWAARSVRDGQGGCAAAVARFDQVTTRAFGSTTGYEATLDAGRCYRDLGNTTTARARFTTLLSVPAYSDRAQDELDRMSPQAAKRMTPAPVVARPPAATGAPPAAHPADANQGF